LWDKPIKGRPASWSTSGSAKPIGLVLAYTLWVYVPRHALLCNTKKQFLTMTLRVTLSSPESLSHCVVHPYTYLVPRRAKPAAPCPPFCIRFIYLSPDIHYPPASCMVGFRRGWPRWSCQ